MISPPLVTYLPWSSNLYSEGKLLFISVMKYLIVFCAIGVPKVLMELESGVPYTSMPCTLRLSNQILILLATGKNVKSKWSLR